MGIITALSNFQMPWGMNMIMNMKTLKTKKTFKTKLWGSGTQVEQKFRREVVQSWDDQTQLPPKGGALNQSGYGGSECWAIWWAGSAAPGLAPELRAHAAPSQEWSDKECQAKDREFKILVEPEKEEGAMSVVRSSRSNKCVMRMSASALQICTLKFFLRMF